MYGRRKKTLRMLKSRILGVLNFKFYLFMEYEAVVVVVFDKTMNFFLRKFSFISFKCRNGTPGPAAVVGMRIVLNPESRLGMITF